MKRLFLSLCLGCAVIMPANALEPGTPVIKVQSGDAAYRISVLEEQIRQLNGRIEELTFQLLEMQEKIRRQNEDNEFRFQELEEKGSLENGSSGNLAASAEGDDGLEKPEPSDQTVINTDTDGTSATRETQTATASIGNEPAANAPTIDGVEIFQGEPGLDPNPSGTLGTIQFDANGNIVDSTIGKPLDLTALPRAGEESDVLPGDANELFDLGYDHVQTGRYEDAEKWYAVYLKEAGFDNIEKLTREDNDIDIYEKIIKADFIFSFLPFTTSTNTPDLPPGLFKPFTPFVEIFFSYLSCK